MNLDKEIDRALGRIWGGDEEPKEVLRKFATKVRRNTPGTVERLVHSCPVCKEKDVPCFSCRAKEIAGEQGGQMVDEVIPQLGKMAADGLVGLAKDMLTRRKVAKQMRAHQQQRPGPPPRRTPPPPAGPQKF